MSTKRERFNSLKQFLADTVRDHEWAHENNEDAKFLTTASVIHREDDFVVVAAFTPHWNTRTGQVQRIDVSLYTTTHWGEPTKVQFFDDRDARIMTSSGGQCEDASAADVAKAQLAVWMFIQNNIDIFNQASLEENLNLVNNSYQNFQTSEEKLLDSE